MMILGRCTRRLIDISLRKVSPDPQRVAPWGDRDWLRDIMPLPIVCDVSLRSGAPTEPNARDELTTAAPCEPSAPSRPNLLPSRRPNPTRRDERSEAPAPTEPNAETEVLSTTEETGTPSEPIAEAHVPSRARETAAPTEPNAETEVLSATAETAAPSEPNAMSAEELKLPYRANSTWYANEIKLYQAFAPHLTNHAKGRSVVLPNAGRVVEGGCRGFRLVFGTRGTFDRSRSLAGSVPVSSREPRRFGEGFRKRKIRRRVASPFTISYQSCPTRALPVRRAGAHEIHPTVDRRTIAA